MATRVQTISFPFAALASLTNNTLTNFTQRTVYIPNLVAFRSVWVEITGDDIITATGGTLTTKTINLRLGAASYTSVANANSLTTSAEGFSFRLEQEFTSHFTANWTGTSMTCDVQVQLNQSTGTTLGFVNVCCKLKITYEYDDTAATQISTVVLPLNWAVGALGTTKPGTALATIPALDTDLAENGKTIRGMCIHMRGNMNNNGGTTDSTLSAQIDTYTALTTGNHEAALGSCRFHEYVWNIEGLGMTTNATHGFFVWGSQAYYHHWQAELEVTYEWTLSGTTTATQSLKASLRTTGAYMGGTTSSDYLRMIAEVWIEEPATITTKELAAYLFWDANDDISGLNVRLGTGSFVAYTDNLGTAPAGGNALMVRNDSAFTLARGKNVLTVDIYRTDTTDLGVNVGGYLLLRYTSGIASAGVGAHNKTVEFPIFFTGTGAAANGKNGTVQPVQLPESDYFISSVFVDVRGHVHSTGTQAGVVMLAKRVEASESYQSWEELLSYNTITYNGAEMGTRYYLDGCTRLFDRYPGDPRNPDALDIELSRFWEVRFGQGASGWIHHAALNVTYHSILSTVSDSVEGSSGGTVEIGLYDAATGELLKTTSRVGNGAYSIGFYGDTREVFTACEEPAASKSHRSQNGYPTLV